MPDLTRRLRLLLGAFAFLALARGGEEAKPELLSGPYVIDLATDGATVCWQTAKPTTGAVDYTLPGTLKWQHRVEPKNKRFHAVRLEPLARGMEYHAKVRAGLHELGRLTFRTAPEKLDRFTFFAYGDTRAYPEDHGRVARAMRAVIDETSPQTFVLNTGDLADDGSDEVETARQFFRPAAPVLERLPILAAKGNHEVGGGLFDKYFPMPEPPAAARGARDACFDYGSVRIVVMDQFTERAERARALWLAERLAEAPDKWRFVSFHAPIYSTGSHGSDKRWRSLVEPALRAGRVHAVFCGHDHNYERTRAIGGVTHFVTGGGGAPLRGGLRRARPEWSRKFLAVHHFLTVDVSPEKLTVTAHRVGLETRAAEAFDSVEIPREAGWPTAGAYGEAVDGGPGDASRYDWDAEGRAMRRETLRVALLGGCAGLLVVALVVRVVRRRRGRRARV